jgi:transcriptional regulator with XRE-family HTH domain
MAELGEKIKKLRFEKKWSQDKLAEKVGVGRQYISRYETGKILPNAENLQKVAEVFGVSIDYLLNSNEAQNLASVGIKDKTLLNLFAEVEKMNENDQLTIRNLLEAMVMKNKLQDLMSSKQS